LGPMERDKNDLGNGGAGGDDRLRHAKRTPGQDDRWLRSVVENISEIVIVVDPDGTLRYANPAWKRAFGHDPREAVGTMNVLDHVHPEDLPRVLEETERALAEGGITANEAEFRFRRKDGSWRWVESVGTYLLDDTAGNGVVVTSRDVTERKEAEEKLRFHARLLDTVGEAVIALDVDGRVSYWNRAAEDLYGWPSEEAMGSKLREMVVPEDLQGRAEEIAGQLREGRAWRGEFVVRRRDGTTFSVEGTDTPIFGKDGDLIGVIGVLRDVTERKEAEEATRSSEERLRSLADSAFEGILISDRGEILEANRALTDMFGYALEELVGRSALEFVAPEHRDLARNKIASGDEEPYEILGVRKDGTRLNLEVRGRAYSYRGHDVRVTAVRDVTERKRAGEALREAEERYRTLVEQIPAVTYIDPVDDPDTSLYTSPHIERMLGYTPKDWISDRLWYERLHPDDRERVLAADERFEAGSDEQFSEEYRLLAKDGSVVWVREEAVLVRDGAGKPLYWQGVILDVTEHEEAEQRLREAERRYRAVVENVPAVTYTQNVGEPLTALYVSPRMRDLTGHFPAEFEEDPDLWYAVVHPDDRRMVEAEDRRTEETGEPFSMEYRMVHRDGRVVWVRDDAVLVRDEADAPLYWQGVITNVTERKALEEQLKHQALHDPLTKLPNRTLFDDRLRLALRRGKRRKNSLAVLFVDLDNFKVINDSLGHEAGDRLLVLVTERLRAAVRPEDTVARLGGDEFIFLLEEVELGEARNAAERILTALESPITLKGRTVYVAASVGVALGGKGTRRAEDLLRDADLAMYRAKGSGKARYAVLEEGMNTRALERLELEHGIRRALERGEFTVYYQPKVSLESGRAVGFEALVRWHHPERGLLTPDAFISTAEETGLIVPIGERVLREACRQAVEWHLLHPSESPPSMCVNLSARQFREPGLPEAIARVLDETGLEPGRLFLEVTESTAMGDAPATAATFDSLKRLGVRTIIDDFGTGYSSLSYLGRFPVEYVRIDRSFVAGLGEDRTSTLLTKGVIGLAHALDLKVIAEGVETQEQLLQLREMGCDLAQGFYFSEPVTGEAAEQRLVGRRLLPDV
jgi:diguanylate cyclase (GGDEF)-like protein/PAS domain S-box-containing protein